MTDLYFKSSDGAHVLAWPRDLKPLEGYSRISRAEFLRLRKSESIADLRRDLKDGATVYCILRHVSASGMSRRISVVSATTDRDGKPMIQDHTFEAATRSGGSFMTATNTASP